MLALCSTTTLYCLQCLRACCNPRRYEQLGLFTSAFQRIFPLPGGQLTGTYGDTSTRLCCNSDTLSLGELRDSRIYLHSLGLTWEESLLQFAMTNDEIKQIRENICNSPVIFCGGKNVRVAPQDFSAVVRKSPVRNPQVDFFFYTKALSSNPVRSRVSVQRLGQFQDVRFVTRVLR